MVTNESLVVAAHEQCPCASTSKLPVPPLAAALPLTGSSVNVQGGGTATVRVTGISSMRFAEPGTVSPINPWWVPSACEDALRFNVTAPGVVPPFTESVAPGMPDTWMLNGNA